MSSRYSNATLFSLQPARHCFPSHKLISQLFCKRVRPLFLPPPLTWWNNLIIWPDSFYSQDFMPKMDLFIPILLFSLLLPIVHGAHDPPPTEYRHTLSDLSQAKTLHCTSLPATERLLCELEGALDAQGRPATTKKLNPPLPPLSTCKFRNDNVYGLYPYAMPPSPALNRVLDKYDAMHRRCREADSDASLNRVYYISSEKPTCQYLLWRPGKYGFGNLLLSVISSFLYAIMSARVLLIEYPNWDNLFCEPFSGSSIQLQAATRLNQYVGESYVQFRDGGCRPEGKSNNSPCKTTVVNFVLDHTAPEREFEAITCPMGFARLRETPFITMWKCNNYFVPGFYLNPVLSPLLDVLFPQRNPFHLLSRFLLAPTDGMWSRISSHVDVHASRRIGVQVRQFGRRYMSEYDGNVIQCIRKKGGFLPKKFRKPQVHAGEYVGVYMATLIERHLKEVDSSMRVLAEEAGEEFRLKFQRLDGREVHDLTHQAEAMVDMWVLSLSHVLVTSRGSTFGYIASGLSGVFPYFIDLEQGKSCFMGLGVEPCFHTSPDNLFCDREEAGAISMKDLVSTSSKVGVCNDRQNGWTVLPPR